MNHTMKTMAMGPGAQSHPDGDLELKAVGLRKTDNEEDRSATHLALGIDHIHHHAILHLLLLALEPVRKVGFL